MHKAFDWKHSIISMWEVEAVPQSCIPQVQIGLSIVFHRNTSCLKEILTIVV
jgi:hypothetical protein